LFQFLPWLWSAAARALPLVFDKEQDVMGKTSYLVAEDPTVDLQIAEALTAELEEYLLKNDLYRTVIIRIPGHDQSLQMTGGDLLTRLHRLQSVRDQLSPAWQQRLDTVDQQARATSYSLRTRFHERLQRELKTRLDSLKWFLDDCASEPLRCRAEFPFEMRNRQRIEEILKELGTDASADLTAGVRAVDQRLRLITYPTDFTWDARLQTAFPRTPYWYLYVSP
jgi:hypothetical protein